MAAPATRLAVGGTRLGIAGASRVMSALWSYTVSTPKSSLVLVVYVPAGIVLFALGAIGMGRAGAQGRLSKGRGPPTAESRDRSPSP
jgi:hypothetical protein